VWHLQYNDWQEQGLPRNVSSYLQFLEELSELRRLTVRQPGAIIGKTHSSAEYGYYYELHNLAASILKSLVNIE
jgi:hypothetical protein